MDNGNTNGETQPGIGKIILSKSIRLVKIKQFLPSRERDALYAALCENQAAFQHPGGLGSDAPGSLYLSLESSGGDHSGVNAIQQASRFLSTRILEIFPSLITALDIEPFTATMMPLTFVNGLDGHCGLPHADSIDGRYSISLLYYFHVVPQVFQGGDLEFYEADPSSPTGIRAEPLASIDQEDNLLIAFPSETFHGITNVRCESKDFADGRFAAIGFLGR